MTEKIKESFKEDSITPLSIGKLKMILFQMENYYVCKINKGKEKGTGFFINIPNENEFLPMLVTCEHILNKEDLQEGQKIIISFLNDKITREIVIDDDRFIFTDPELDVSFIEIKEEDKINKIQFLEIDNNIYNDEEKLNEKFKKLSAYILSYLNGKYIVASFGVISEIKNKVIYYSCNSSYGSSGSPILCLETNKVIGVHFGYYREDTFYNHGTLINYAIERLIIKLNSSHKLKLEIDSNEKEKSQDNDNKSREKSYNKIEEDKKLSTYSHSFYHKNNIKRPINKLSKDNKYFQKINTKSSEKNNNLKRKYSTFIVRKSNFIDLYNLNNKIDFDEKTKINKKYEISTNRVIKKTKKALNKIDEANSDDEMEKIKKNDNISFYAYKHKNNKKNCQNIRNVKSLKKTFNLKPGCYPRYPSKNFPVYQNVEIKSIIYKNIKNLNSSNSKDNTFD